MYNDAMNQTTQFDLHNPEHWTIPRVVLAQAEQRPDRIAIDFVEHGHWTYADCKNHALTSAAQLQAAGITAGDNVALMVNSSETFCRYWLGLSMAGATMVAINTSMQGAPLAHQLDISNCSFLISDTDNQQACNAIEHKAKLLSVETLAATSAVPLTNIETGNSHDLSCIMFTSGTSGPSKGVLMPQAHCLLFAIGTIDNYRCSGGLYRSPA